MFQMVSEPSVIHSLVAQAGMCTRLPISDVTHQSIRTLRIIVAWRNLSNYLKIFLQIHAAMSTGYTKEATSSRPTCYAASWYVYLNS